MLEGASLSDTEMMDGYAAATVEPGRPAPTIEALLHHALPFASVLHTHADAIVAITDTERGLDLVTELLGDEVVPVPYVMPGFDLAKVVPELWRGAGSSARAIVLQHHGLFTMGDTVDEALALHLELVERAEARIAALGRPIRAPFADTVSELRPGDSEQARTLLTELRRYSAGHVHALRCDDDEVRAFLARPDLERLTDLGPTTLEHVIRTKRVPLLGDDVAGYVAEYRRYFERNRGADEALVMLDPIPRVVLHPDLGLVAVGADAKAAGAVMDIYRHTIRVIEAAERLGGYRTVTEAQAFGLEYWELEQRRLR
jgi:rhamnose utilization protein RhaD (predicted bifunctional aldolase and dehydrogenase)